jgi:hypothetical protein
MRLASHFHRLQGDNIEDRPVGGEEHVERRAQVVLLYLARGKICDIQAVSLLSAQSSDCQVHQGLTSDLEEARPPWLADSGVVRLVM